MRVLDIFRSPLVAIDVGTATTRVCFDASRVVERPSIVREEVRAAIVARPVMRAGVVADIAGVAAVVEELLDAKRSGWRRRPGAVVCAPTDVSAREREALIEAVTAGGASVVTVVPEPLAAAIGAGVDVASEHATAILDIGEGVADLAVIRDASIFSTAATRIGCGTLRAAIHDWTELQRRASEPLSEEAVERIVRAYCAGVDVALRHEDVGMLLDPVIDRIARFVADAIQELPDEVAAEVIESGIHVTGGGALLDRVVTHIEQTVGLPLKRADEPLHAVIRGAGEMLRYGVR